MGSLLKTTLLVVCLWGPLTFGALELCKNTDKARGAAQLLLDEGTSEIQDAIAILNSPTSALAGKPLPPSVQKRLGHRALEFLSKGDASNRVHLQEHISALENPEVRAALAEAGLSELTTVLNVLLHDLGKEYRLLPESYRSAMEEVFPVDNSGKPDPKAFYREILPHELGSMVMVRKFAKEMGLEREHADYLNALYAGHNAGYDPSVRGFWTESWAWPGFAKIMRAKGFDLPEQYPAVLSKDQGGKLETVILTAIDRATSMTLASQEKFAYTMLKQGNFTTEGLAGNADFNLSSVPPQIENVLSRVDSFLPSEKAARVKKSVLDHFEKEKGWTQRLAQELRAAASEVPEGSGMSPAEIANSVPYKDVKGNWVRVGNDGRVFTFNPAIKSWFPRVAPAGDPVAILFRDFIYPKMGFKVPTLQVPEVLR